MIWLLFLVFLMYAVLIVTLAIGFRKGEEFTAKESELKTTFSVIIPFRNEAKNLPFLLNSIEEIKYPIELVEFLFVDDDSSDNSVIIIERILPKTKKNIQILQNKRGSNSPKKDAITTAISVAKNEWILTTDADCILSENWLKSFANFIQKKAPKMIVAPVNYQVKNTFLEQFQVLDFLSMQGTTIGSFGGNFPFLCNGANLGYKKEEFMKLNGFDGNNNIASGDDIFLFEKFIKADKNNVKYLKSKEAIVTTFPVKNWTDLVNQRTRWASKTSTLSSLKVKLIGVLVVFTNFLIVSSFITASIQFVLMLLIVKMSIDLFLFLPTIVFFNHRTSFFKWYVLASFLYPFFNVFVLFKSLFFTYKWKGRTFKK